MISSVELEIFMKNEKLKAKFPATAHGYSMVKFAHLDGAFFRIF